MASELRHSDRAYLTLREEIIAGKLRPGEALPEAATAVRLNVSRSPVREAMRRLAGESLVNIVPGRGAFVSTVSLTDVLELYQLREVLEPLASRLASKQPAAESLNGVLDEMRRAPVMIDDNLIAEYYELCARMDAEIAEISSNARLAAMLGDLWQQVRRARSIANSSTERLHRSVEEHIGILEAILADDGDLAAERTRQHLRNSLNHVFRAVGEYGGVMAAAHE